MASREENIRRDLKKAGFTGDKLEAALERVLQQQTTAVARPTAETAGGAGGGFAELRAQGETAVRDVAGKARDATTGLAGRAASSTAQAFIPREAEDLRGATVLGGTLAGAARGGLAGAARGLPGGLPGVIAGAGLGGIAGGVLGAAGGQTVFDLGEELAGGEPRGIVANTTRALNEAALEAIFPGGSGVIKAGKRAIFAKIAGIEESGRRIIAAAQELGIPIGIEAVTKRGTISRARRILGRFPFLGPGFKESDEAVGSALRGRKDTIVGSIAPVVQAVTETGVDLAGGAIKRNKAMNRLFRRGYTKLLDDAERAGSRIPTDETVQAAQDLVVTHRRELPLKRVGKGKELREVPISQAETPQEVLDFAENELANLTEDMSPRAYQRLARELNALIDANRKNPTVAGQAMILKRALEKDLENILGPQEFREGIRTLNGQFSSYMKLLATPTGKGLGRATPGLFEVGLRPGSVNQDEVFRLAFNSGSPQAMLDLRRLVGRNPFKRAVATHVDSAFDAAEETSKDGVFINLKSLKRSLGLDKPKSPQFKALKTALDASESGVKISDLQKFFDVMDAQFKLGVVDVSLFVARRAQIGGLRAGARALTPGASLVSGAGGAAGATAGGIFGGASGAALALAGVFGSRGLSRLFASRAGLLKAITMLDPATALSARQKATRSFIRLMGEEPFRQERSPNAALSELATGQARLPAQGLSGLGQAPQ